MLADTHNCCRFLFLCMTQSTTQMVTARTIMPPMNTTQPTTPPTMAGSRLAPSSSSVSGDSLRRKLLVNVVLVAQFNTGLTEASRWKVVCAAGDIENATLPRNA